MVRWLSEKLLTRVRKWAFTTMPTLSCLGVITFAVVLLKIVIIHMIMIIYTEDYTQNHSQIMRLPFMEKAQLKLDGHLSTIWEEDSSTGLKVQEMTCRFPFNYGFLCLWVTGTGCMGPNLPPWLKPLLAVPILSQQMYLTPRVFSLSAPVNGNTDKKEKQEIIPEPKIPYLFLTPTNI